uniref:Lichenase-like n=1 Tax=Nicotiana sylvestris TaxID=4096 RepID=A0A1U7V6T3_NICSY|nr:PREDICTED: lichenase-like [Nicotiana sylvestris]
MSFSLTSAYLAPTCAVTNLSTISLKVLMERDGSCEYHVNAPPVRVLSNLFSKIEDTCSLASSSDQSFEVKKRPKIRIFDPNQDVLTALQGSHISVILGIGNEDLQSLASDPTFATNWVQNSVIPHASTVKFTYISAGNEVVPGPLANFVLGALQNIDSALKANNNSRKSDYILIVGFPCYKDKNFSSRVSQLLHKSSRAEVSSYSFSVTRQKLQL